MTHTPRGDKPNALGVEVLLAAEVISEARRALVGPEQLSDRSGVPLDQVAALWTGDRGLVDVLELARLSHALDILPSVMLQRVELRLAALHVEAVEQAKAKLEATEVGPQRQSQEARDKLGAER